MARDSLRNLRRAGEGRYATVMLCRALASWPQPDGWTLVAFILTVLGFVVGAGALVLTWLIYCWTERSDEERHGQLLDALKTLGASYRDLAAGRDVARADLGRLTPAEQAKLQALLQPGEAIVRVERSASGKGNHPWQAVTTQGRMLQVYTGGRLGGVHAREIV